MDRSTARSLIYKMLSLWFVYPDEELYGSIAKGEWFGEFREALLLLDEKKFDRYVRAIEHAIPGRGDGDRRQMAQEYTRLFIDASPHIIAPPYGSTYMRKDGLDSVKTLPEVLRFYKEAGFVLNGDLCDHPDHITHELEFMGTLAGQENQVSANEKIELEEVQMNFLSRFILPWVPAFCDKVVEQSRFPFYHHLGNLTKEFVNFEKNYLAVPEELNF
jgi:DMSO reductase family type II enzyme chaperone